MRRVGLLPLLRSAVMFLAVFLTLVSFSSAQVPAVKCCIDNFVDYLAGMGQLLNTNEQANNALPKCQSVIQTSQKDQILADLTKKQELAQCSNQEKGDVGKDLGAPLKDLKAHCGTILFGRSSVDFKDCQGKNCAHNSLGAYNNAAKHLNVISHEALNMALGKCADSAQAVNNAFTYLKYAPYLTQVIYRSKGYYDETAITSGKLSDELDGFFDKCIALPFYSCFEFKHFFCNTQLPLYWMTGEVDSTTLPDFVAGKNTDIKFQVIDRNANGKYKGFCTDKKLTVPGLLKYDTGVIGFIRMFVNKYNVNLPIFEIDTYQKWEAAEKSFFNAQNPVPQVPPKSTKRGLLAWLHGLVSSKKPNKLQQRLDNIVTEVSELEEMLD